MSISKDYEVAKSVGRGERTFPLERIAGHKMISKRETVFKVKWLGFTVKDCTLEPLEHLLSAPEALLNYVEKSRKAFHNAMPSQESDSGATFHPPNKEILRQCKSEEEFVPSGSEKVRKIDAEIVYDKEGFFWLVRFWCDKDNQKLVRRSLMEYYYPLESLMFLNKNTT